MTSPTNQAVSPEECSYRVWPDGTIQECEYAPHSHMSDDYATIEADSYDDAYLKARLLGYVD